MTHLHNYQSQGNHYVCSCGKKILKFKDQVGIKENGVQWTKKKNQNKFLRPAEWLKIEEKLGDKAKHTALILLNTGMRIRGAESA